MDSPARKDSSQSTFGDSRPARRTDGRTDGKMRIVSASSIEARGKEWRRRGWLQPDTNGYLSLRITRWCPFETKRDVICHMSHMEAHSEGVPGAAVDQVEKDWER